MKTTLTELLAKITPLPYAGFTRYILRNGRFLATAHAVGDDAPSGLGFAPGQEPHQSMEKAEANGTYLRHCANVLPDVVEALKGCLRVAEAAKHDANPYEDLSPGDSAEYDAACMEVDRITQALAKAENITT